MKKFILTTVAIPLFTFVLFAQNSGVEKVYSKGVNLLNLGVGFGNIYFGASYNSSLGVNPTVSYEYAINDKFSIGGVLAYTSVKSNILGDKFKNTGIMIGPRGSYHFATTNKFDPYVGATMGYVIVSSSSSDYPDIKAKASGVGGGFYIGARYFPKNTFGFHAEFGYTSFSFLTTGVSFKL